MPYVITLIRDDIWDRAETLNEYGEWKMSIVSARIAQIKGSETKAMTRRAALLREQGRDVITLSQGELDFDTPENVREAGIRAIREGMTRYTAVPGVAPLRDAIREKLSRDNGLEYAHEQITVGCGAKQIIFNALLASINPGDEVVIPSPCWVSYPEMVKLVGGSPVVVRCSENDGFKLSAEALEAAITPRTKWLILNTPSNPTGAVYNQIELRSLGEVLEAHPNVLVMSDEIYENLVYGETVFVSAASATPNLFERTLTINGVSKASAMTGWRLGYGAGPIELIRAMNVIQGQTVSHASSISQYAALEAIAGDRSYVPAFQAELKKRRDLALKKLNNASGLECRRPDGAFYLFPACGSVIGCRTPTGQTIESDSDFAMYLLESAGVAVVSGTSFLASPYIRISFALSTAELDRACDRIVDACASLTK